MAIWDYLYPTKMISSFLHPEKGYEKASEMLKEYLQKAEGYQRPYLEAGTNQIGRLTGAEDVLLNPEALEAKWAAGYNTSPYAKSMIERAKNAGLNAASSMGLMGSSPAIENIQTSANELAQKDRQQYMEDLMQKYLAGIGIGQNIYGIGATTAGNMGNQAVNAGGNLGALAFGKENAPGALFGKLLGQGMNAAANAYAGGGGGFTGYSG